jgi:ferritin-like protein
MENLMARVAREMVQKAGVDIDKLIDITRTEREQYNE